MDEYGAFGNDVELWKLCIKKIEAYSASDGES